MRLGYDLTTEQSQRLVMSPVLLQSLRILAMNAQDLGDYAGEALLANPVLEEESPYKEGLQAYLQEYYAAGSRSLPRGAGTSVQGGDALWQAAMQDADGQPDLAGILRRQLGLTKADDLVRSLCDYLIDSLDDGGYLTVTVEETVALGKGAIPREKVEEALALLQSFDPAGVGARSVGECLELQLARRGELDDCYRQLLEEDLDLLSRNRIRELADKYGLTAAQMQQRVDVIRNLSPAPGSVLSQPEETVYLLPDVLLEKTANGYTASVNERIVPSLRVSAYYESLMKEGAADADTQKYLKERVESAVRLLNAIAQRKETIRKVAQSIVDHQTAFLDGSVRDMKPLTMRQVAEETGLHVSTVSRTVRGKYMECPCGLLELRSFFSGRLGTAADGVSAKSARAVLAEILKQEDSRKPYSDETIAGMMQEKGIAISRRTVAKYRGQLGIPGSSKRRRY